MTYITIRRPHGSYCCNELLAALSLSAHPNSCAFRSSTAVRASATCFVCHARACSAPCVCTISVVCTCVSMCFSSLCTLMHKFTCTYTHSRHATHLRNRNVTRFYISLALTTDEHSHTHIRTHTYSRHATHLRNRNVTRL